jgi:phenylalanyl-tRNA synthetase beta chain
MIVSHHWLSEYVEGEFPLEELTHRLTMSGLNLEGTESVGDDTAIDLEVTSNRPDCLGHIGVAREAAVLFGLEHRIPDAAVQTVKEKTSDATSVVIECPDLCPQYIARVIKGVKVGPSPEWMQQRLRTLGITPINNIVDVTNYVLMECGQPLHTFDYDRLAEGRIVVRRARNGETIEAIDHKTYQLTEQMCVIADARSPVAIGGVMGGAATEISEGTVNVLVETANFAPLSIRGTARHLSLFSDSSYRFERGIDEQQLLWASNRCCQLILRLAGGELLDEPVIAGGIPEWSPDPVTLRFAQIERLLGIEIPADECVRILSNLGLRTAVDRDAGSASFVPPSWRRDLTRECDLIEEVGRIHGYEQVPEDADMPVVATHETPRETVLGRIADVLTGAGFYEALTMSFVSSEAFARFTPRPEAQPLRVEHSSRKQENILRQSLIPSLLECRRENERQGTFDARLYEIAAVYLNAAPGEPAAEPTMLSLVSGGSFAEVRGVIDAIAAAVNRKLEVTARPAEVPQFAEGRGAELLLDGKPWGWLGELDRSVTDQLDLRDAVTACEVDVQPLIAALERSPQFTPLPQYPAIERDLNFVLDESVTWERLAATVTSAAGPLLDDVRFVDQYRGKQIPAGKKSYVLSVAYRSPDRTLTGEEVDAAQVNVVAACEAELKAVQR